MGAPPRVQLSAELAPDAPAWWRDRVAPVLQKALRDSTGALANGLSFGENFAGCISTQRIRMPTTAPNVRAWARASLSTAQSLADSTLEVVRYDTTDFDSRGLIEGAGTSAWKFVCDEDATYQVSSYGHLATAGAAGAFMLLLAKNGSEAARLGSVLPGSTGEFGAGASTLLQLVAGDYLDIRAYQTCGSPRNLLGGGLTNHVSIAQLSDSPERIVPSCFPLPFRALVQGKPFRPLMVLLGNLKDPGGGAPVISGTLGQPVWDWDGKGLVRILDLAGLAYGSSYDATFVVLAG